MLQSFTGERPGFDQRVLAAHNRERSRLGIASLQWDENLAGDAQAWAEQLARTSQFEHAARYLRPGAGENIWMGTKSAYSAEEMVDAWAREKKAFKRAPFPADPLLMHEIGHYTQIVWRDSERIGCGLARGKRMDYLVCRYDEAGNVIGRLPY